MSATSKHYIQVHELRDPAAGRVVYVSAGPATDAERQAKSANDGCSAWWREQIAAKRHKRRPTGRLPDMRPVYPMLRICQAEEASPKVHTARRYPPVYGQDCRGRKSGKVGWVSEDWLAQAHGMAERRVLRGGGLPHQRADKPTADRTVGEEAMIRGSRAVPIEEDPMWSAEDWQQHYLLRYLEAIERNNKCRAN